MHERWMAADPEYIERRRVINLKSYYKRMADPERRAKIIASARRRFENKREKIRTRENERRKKIADLVAALRLEMPEILKEFGL